MNAQDFPIAAPWQVSQWFNTAAPLTLEALRGRVVVLEAFQMLCPGCVSHGLPQAQRIAALFASQPVSVIGLHTVFEHHAAMGPVSLAAFLHEYRIDFPVGVDEAAPDGPLPRTMQAYGMRGTPSLLLIDQQGRLRLNHFGRLDDMRVGAEIAALLSQGSGTAMAGRAEARGGGCDANGCAVP